MRCPICGREVDSDDYWCDDRCLLCAQRKRRKTKKEKVEIDKKISSFLAKVVKS